MSAFSPRRCAHGARRGRDAANVTPLASDGEQWRLLDMAGSTITARQPGNGCGFALLIVPISGAGKSALVNRLAITLAPNPELYEMRTRCAGGEGKARGSAKRKVVRS